MRGVILGYHAQVNHDVLGFGVEAEYEGMMGWANGKTLFWISQADAVCRVLPGINDVKVNLVWTPPWDPRTMASEEAKLDLGIF